MAITAMALTNPGGETAGAAGWTKYSGSGTLQSTGGGPTFPPVPRTGSGALHFSGFNTFNNNYGQQLAIPAGTDAAVDAGTAAVHATCWQISGSGDTVQLYVSFYESDGTTLISTETSDLNTPTSYTKRELYIHVPADTRFIRIGADHPGLRGASDSAQSDDYALEFSDDHINDWPDAFANKALQLGAYALGQFPTDQIRAYQLPITVVASAETSNGFHDLKAYQLGAYALVRGKIDRRDLRAWTFTQDDHDFYVLQLGDVGTLVFDKLTGQWAQWRSPSFAYWRGNDGVQWEGWNICCDSESGKLWIIDPTERLDYDTTPITSVVSGRVTSRMRKNAQCHMAELAVSEGEPPVGIDASTLTITLRTSDDDGHSFVTHGSVTGEDIGDDITVRWYGLGVMPAPGRVFEITDTGYARRVDGFNIEVGDGSVG